MLSVNTYLRLQACLLKLWCKGVLKYIKRFLQEFILSIYIYIYIYIYIKISRYWPGVAQRVGRVIAVFFHDCGTRRGWMVSSTPRPNFNPGKDPAPFLQGTGWAPGPVWTCGNSCPHWDSIPDRPARSQSLYRLSYRAHISIYIYIYVCIAFKIMFLIHLSVCS